MDGVLINLSWVEVTNDIKKNKKLVGYIGMRIYQTTQ